MGTGTNPGNPGGIIPGGNPAGGRAYAIGRALIPGGPDIPIVAFKSDQYFPSDAIA
jgi:hypothetical protein